MTHIAKSRAKDNQYAKAVSIADNGFNCVMKRSKFKTKRFSLQEQKRSRQKCKDIQAATNIFSAAYRGYPPDQTLKR